MWSNFLTLLQNIFIFFDLFNPYKWSKTFLAFKSMQNCCCFNVQNLTLVEQQIFATNFNFESIFCFLQLLLLLFNWKKAFSCVCVHMRAKSVSLRARLTFWLLNIIAIRNLRLGLKKKWMLWVNKIKKRQLKCLFYC